MSEGREWTCLACSCREDGRGIRLCRATVKWIKGPLLAVLDAVGVAPVLDRVGFGLRLSREAHGGGGRAPESGRCLRGPAIIQGGRGGRWFDLAGLARLY